MWLRLFLSAYKIPSSCVTHRRVKSEFLISQQRDKIFAERWHLLSDSLVEQILGDLLSMQALLQVTVVSPSSFVFLEGGAGLQH